MLNDHRLRIYKMYLSNKNNHIKRSNIKDLKSRLPFLKSLIIRHFPKNKKAIIFDFGCGNGLLVYLAKQMGFLNIKGVDISQEQIAFSKKLKNDGVEHGDGIKAIKDMDRNSLDCFITYDVIEHFNRSELLQLIDNVYGILRHDGRWIIHVPNAESPFGMRIRYGDLTHELAFTKTSLTQALLLSGFSRVDCYEDQPIPHGLKSSIRYLLWKILRFLLWCYIAIETGEIDRNSIFSQNFLAVAYK